MSASRNHRYRFWVGSLVLASLTLNTGCAAVGGMVGSYLGGQLGPAGRQVGSFLGRELGKQIEKDLTHSAPPPVYTR